MNHQRPLQMVVTMFALLMFTACYQDSATDLKKTKADSANTEQSETANAKQATAVTDSSASTGDWPLFRGNGRSQGVAISKLPKKLEVIWKHEVKNGAFEGTPIIVGKKKPVAYIGDADGTLFAFNLKDGTVLWEFKSEIGYTTAPAYRDGKLFIGDLDGKFYCVDSDGKLVWDFQADGSIDSSANFHKDLVLFGAQDARLYALNVKTGKQVWQLETNDQVRCSITVVGGQAFVAGCDGGLHIVDLDNGKEIHNVMIDSPTGVTPAAQGDFIYVGTEQSGFHAIDWKNAKPKWKFNDDEGSISTRSSPSVNSNHVIFGARDRTVYSLNPNNGKKNWSTELKANVDSSPVIVQDRVFVGSTDGRLYEIELKTGKIVWQTQLDGGFIGSPAVGFNRLVIATERGVVYCLGKKSR